MHLVIYAPAILTPVYTLTHTHRRYLLLPPRYVCVRPYLATAKRAVWAIIHKFVC